MVEWEGVTVDVGVGRELAFGVPQAASRLPIIAEELKLARRCHR